MPGIWNHGAEPQILGNMKKLKLLVLAKFRDIM